MLISNPDYLNATQDVLMRFMESTKDYKLTSNNDEYSDWVLNTRSAFSENGFQIDGLLRKKQTFLLNLANFIRSPGQGYKTILSSENIPMSLSAVSSSFTDNQLRILDFVPAPSKNRLSRERTNITRCLRLIFSHLGDPLPGLYQKLYYDDVGRKFVRNSILSLSGGADSTAAAIAAVVYEHWPSIIGRVEDPISDRLRCAVIWHAPEGRSVLCVTTEGQPMFLFVPKQLAKTNETALQVCETEIREVVAGCDPTLGPGKYPFVMDILSPFMRKTFGERGNRRGRPGGGRDFIDVSSPISDRVLDEIRKAVLPLKTSAKVFDEEFLSSAYSGSFMSMNMRLNEARLCVQNALDPSAHTFLSQMGMNDLRTLGWFTGAPNLLPNMNSLRIRQDAEDAFCATGPLFYVAKHPAFQEAVCERRPILPIVRDVTGLTKAQINVISAMPTPASPKEVITKFPPFDPEVFRGKTLRDIAESAQIYEILCHANPHKKLAALAAEAAKVFDADVKHSVQDVKDVIQAIEDKIITPMSMSIHDEIVECTKSHLRELLYPKTISKIAAINHIYHQNRLWEELENRGDERIMAVWTALTSPKICAGLGVRELTSTEDIRIQGRKQSHCVGGYARYVLKGREILLSVDDEHGVPHSTVEVILHNPNMVLSMENVQHRAAFNQHPSHQANMAVEEFLRVSLPEAQSRIQAYLKDLEDAERSAVRIRQNNPEYAFHILSPILPEKIVTAGYHAVRTMVIKRFEDDTPDPRDEGVRTPDAEDGRPGP